MMDRDVHTKWSCSGGGGGGASIVELGVQVAVCMGLREKSSLVS